MTVLGLLRHNRNYRYMWFGQVISEVGDHFNNIAVFALGMRYADGGLVVAGILIARAIPMLLAGPVAGVVLDRLDRRTVMIASDLLRFALALLFIPAVEAGVTWPLYLLSAVLMAASPFFTSGRSAIMPAVARKLELHAANSLTQTTSWATTALGAFLGGTAVESLGYEWAFFVNGMSFAFSAWCISLLRGDFRAPRARERRRNGHPWREFGEGLKYVQAHPLLLGICLISVGWATGGGAAQILFSVFAETVFRRGPAGIGQIWACAGVGLVLGGLFAHWLGQRIDFFRYKITISVAYLVHGGSYVLFALAESYPAALLLIGLSRAAVAVSSVLNTGRLLRHIDDQYRGRVFALLETMTWTMMMISMMLAGVASTSVNPRLIGVVAGGLSSTTGIFWGWANWAGKLPEPSIPVHQEDLRELEYGTR